MEEMVQRNIIPALGAALKFAEPRIIFVALEGLTNVFNFGKQLPSDGNNPYCLIAEQYGIIDQLEELEVHNNEMVYKKVCEILTTFFEQVEE